MKRMGENHNKHMYYKQNNKPTIRWMACANIETKTRQCNARMQNMAGIWGYGEYGSYSLTTLAAELDG